MLVTVNVGSIEKMVRPEGLRWSDWHKDHWNRAWAGIWPA